MKNWKKFLSLTLSAIGIFALCFGIHGVLSLRKDTQTAKTSVSSVSTAPASSETENTAVSDLQNLQTAEDNSDETVITSESVIQSETIESTSEPYVSPYADFFETYTDVAAWLEIPDTSISYPVMWTPEDEEYYLYRNYDGTDNQNGSLLLDTDSCLNPLTTNLIIHGHNMRSGAMFGTLTAYENQTYYEQHKEMLLFTPEGERKYEIISVFRSQVYKKTEEVFKFYKFFQADTEEEFYDFYDNIKELSLYDTEVTAQFGDHFITLSTCVSHVPTGRFVVVGKEITD